ncbi:kinase-like protein, partial [Ceraceosorus guamensis]
RCINDFVIISDIGRGAYGLVKKVRLKGENGEPTGPEFVVKYIIKSRILADCWRRHKTLGPIPVEIHVMDQLRRLPYTRPKVAAPWAPERLFARQAPENRTLSPITICHPSLCVMLDFFEDHEFYYLVMPYLTGTQPGRDNSQDLFDFVESAPDGLSTIEVRSIFGQVADGVRFLHANSIVHRDIKDENVILDFRDGRAHAQLIDFGSAAHVRPGRLFDTFSGTLDYAAAEILRGEKYGGKEQDVWALGVVGYVLLCGDCPFWNGEEAVEGIAAGTRADNALRDRCLIGEGRPGDPREASAPDTTPEDSGQIDGGGRLDDAADLIRQCLQLDVALRPTAAQVCDHRFLSGRAGW